MDFYVKKIIRNRHIHGFWSLKVFLKWILSSCSLMSMRSWDSTVGTAAELRGQINSPSEKTFTFYATVTWFSGQSNRRGNDFWFRGFTEYPGLEETHKDHGRLVTVCFLHVLNIPTQTILWFHGFMFITEGTMWLFYHIFIILSVAQDWNHCSRDHTDTVICIGQEHSSEHEVKLSCLPGKFITCKLPQ